MLIYEAARDLPLRDVPDVCYDKEHVDWNGN